MTQIDNRVVFTITALMLAVSLVSFINTRNMIARLRETQRALWIALGSPSALYWTLSRGDDLLQSIGTNRVSFTAWLSTKGYLDVNDPKLTKLAQRRKLLTYIGVARALTLVAYGLLRYFRFIVIDSAAA